MADFRKIAVDSVRWFPQSRKVVPCSPIAVQIPPAQCSVEIAPGRYVLHLRLGGHAAHPAFVRFVRAVEASAREKARPAAPGLAWSSCVSREVLKLCAFDSARFFDAAGATHLNPSAMAACSCLCELQGAWTADAHWGLRWKVLEVKEVKEVKEVLDVPAAPAGEAPPTEAAVAACAAMFSDD